MLIQEDLEKNWSLDVIKGTFSATISCSMRFFTTWEIGVLSQKKSFLGKEKERPMGTRKKVGKKLFAVAWKNEQSFYSHFKDEGR